MEVQGIVELIKRSDKDIKKMLRDPSKITEEALDILALRLGSAREIKVDYASYLIQWLSKKGGITKNYDKMLFKNDFNGKINNNVWHNILYKARKGMKTENIESYLSNVLTKKRK